MTQSLKLHCHPISPYARKAIILCQFHGLDVEPVMARTDGARGYTQGANPLGKIPALERDGYPILVDSPVVCEYLDSLGKPLLPSSGDARFEQLRLHAMGDGISDAVYNYRYETVRPATLHWADIITRHETALREAVQALDAQVERLGQPWQFGNLAIVCALDYMDYRAGHIGWRNIATDLAAWHKQFEADALWQDSNHYDAA